MTEYDAIVLNDIDFLPTSSFKYSVNYNVLLFQVFSMHIGNTDFFEYIIYDSVQMDILNFRSLKMCVLVDTFQIPAISINNDTAF